MNTYGPALLAKAQALREAAEVIEPNAYARFKNVAAWLTDRADRIEQEGDR
jgi:hypothetical protein